MQKNKENKKPSSPTSLSAIKNVKTLNELSKHDAQIRRHARALLYNFNFVKYDQSLVDDIVNDMYLKIDAYLKKDKKNKIETGALISTTLKNITLSMFEKHSRLDFNNEDSEGNCRFEKMEYEEEQDEEKDEQYRILDERIARLNWYERGVLELSEEYNMLELSKLSGCSYRALNGTYNRVLELLGIEKK